MPDASTGGAATSSLLVVDDEPTICALLVRALQRGGEYRVESASSAREARERLAAHAFDLVVTDIAMPGEDGISLMHWGREHFPGTTWIVLTGRGTLDSAVRALKLGAFDFIAKPVELAALRNSVDHALSQQRLQRERDRLDHELKRRNAQLREHVRELERVCALLEEQAETIEADLRRAALIQRALLPQAPPHTPGLSVHALYRPSQLVGGDLYDVIRIDKRFLALLVADAAGHGLSAAMLAVLFRSRLPVTDPDTDHPSSPSRVLEAANAALLRSGAVPGLFLTAAYCLLDTLERRVTIASAGHPPVILRRAGGEVERLFHTGPALGLYGDASFVEQERMLAAGDRLLLYTDGLYDRLPAGADAGSDAVVQMLQDAPALLRADGASLLCALARLDGEEPEASPRSDDIALVCLSMEDGPSTFDNGSSMPMPAAGISGTDTDCEILAGGGVERRTVAVRGRATWTHSVAFHEACSGALEVGADVVVDLTSCPFLDSTLLGTIHELAMRADGAHRELRLQGVQAPVRELFSELGMTPMLDHMVPMRLPLPSDMRVVSGAELDTHTRWLRVLRSHESLAAISERNRRAFGPLLERLREELGQIDSGSAVLRG